MNLTNNLKSNPFLLFLSPISLGTIVQINWPYWNLIINVINFKTLAIIFNFILIIICLLVSVAYFTLTERKVMAYVQRRFGPNVVGIWGLLQPLADGVKLLLKEIIVPSKAHRTIFIISPILTFFLSIVGWAVLPFGPWNALIDFELSLLYIFAVSSLGVYGVVLSGWASNSRYPFLGSLRALAQMISYEINIGIVLIAIIVCSGSLNLNYIFLHQSYISGGFWLPLFPLFIVFFISILAETNRTPFDLPEAESELVSGYNTEYSSILFALFFLGEYGNILLMSGIWILLFFGNLELPFGLDYYTSEFGFSLKVVGVALLFIFIRAVFPRMRFDMLMENGWSIFMPITFGYLIFLVGYLIYTDSIIPSILTF